MTMLADQVDVVIGVDTHKHTNTAAVVRASTGGVLDEATDSTTPAGHEELLAIARSHGSLRAWAIEGTSSYGTGLTRFLRANDEWVFELERPTRSDRLGGKKNDPIDAEMIAWFAETFSQAPSQIPDAAREELAALAKARKLLVDGKIRLQAQDEHAAPEPARKAYARVLKSLAAEIDKLEAAISAKVKATGVCRACRDHRECSGPRASDVRDPHCRNARARAGQRQGRRRLDRRCPL